jgi:transglutaminase-like putative cysteine protease
MKRFLWRLVCGILFLLLLATPLQSARASGEFQANYDVEYAVSPAGKTIVTQHVALVNQLANFYPQKYSLLLDSDKITNIIAYDDGGIITPTISVKDGKTSIGLAFNTKAIGLGKSLSFSLRYEHSGVASKNGSIWEIYVPGIVNDPDIGRYDVTLSVPPTFGPVAYLSPLPSNGRKWTKDQMIRGGIAGAYGANQNFDVTLNYSLTNSSVVSDTQDLALPPDTAFQRVQITSLDPKPDTVVRDPDGNWLARYKLLPAQTIAVKAKASVAVFLSPRQDFSTPAIEPETYVKALQYWDATDPKIIAIAQSHPTPRAIYEYVVSTLSYDYARVSANTKRLGAMGALAAPDNAICMEFTDLFIAIARAAHIPARRAVGYAFTTNTKLRPLSLASDILHAWPEYYDTAQKIWIPVDPTWGNTTGGVDYFSKLDFNHIVFAINGTDSVIPYPAGFYKSADSASKDVFVQFATAAPNPSPPTVKTSVDFPSQVGAGTTVNGNIRVQNQGGTSAYNLSVTVLSDIGGIQQTQQIPELLPYGSVLLPIKATFAPSLTSTPGTIMVSVDDQRQTYAFTVQPLYYLIIGGGIFVLALTALVIVGIRKLVWRKT